MIVKPGLPYASAKSESLIPFSPISPEPANAIQSTWVRRLVPQAGKRGKKAANEETDAPARRAQPGVYSLLSP